MRTQFDSGVRHMKHRGSESFVERSGELHEFFLLGEVRHESREYQEELKRRGLNKESYVPFKEAFELVKMFQPIDRETKKPQDPTHPKESFPKDLRVAIADALGLTTIEELNRVKYYTAVGSHLDTFHGVDAFIELEGKTPGESRIVTFDVTLRTEAAAKKGAKANVIIRELNPEDIKKYLKEVDEIADRAIPFLKK